VTILDGKDPRFFFSVITADGGWMIAQALNGNPVVETSFVGTKDEADAIADAWNKREMDYYRSESAQAVENFLKHRPTLEEVAKLLGFKI
jgi:hypothetical protein